MKAMIRKMGNSQGVLIPKPILTQLGLVDEVDMEVENDALVIRRPKDKPRHGWAEAAKAIAEAGDDGLVLGDFPNAGDKDLQW